MIVVDEQSISLWHDHEYRIRTGFVFAFLSNERVYFAYFTSIEYTKTPVLRFLARHFALIIRASSPPFQMSITTSWQGSLVFTAQTSPRYPANYSHVNRLFTLLAVIFA